MNFSYFMMYYFITSGDISGASEEVMKLGILWGLPSNIL